jgi:hypothetical protein
MVVSNQMKNVILLIFTPEDLAFLPEAVQRLRAMAIEFLWVLHTPQLGLPYPASAAALDKEIEDCERDKQRAALAENFDDATKYRDQASGLRVRRELEIKNAYQKIPHAQILAVYDQTFAGLNEETTGIPNIVREALPDPIGADGALGYLASRGTDWYDQFPHGEYAILWIRALPELSSAVDFSKPQAPDRMAPLTSGLGVPPNNAPLPVAQMQNHYASNQERNRLLHLPYFSLKKEATDAGVDTVGKKKEVLVDEILAARELAAI